MTLGTPTTAPRDSMHTRREHWALIAAIFASGFCGMVAEYSVGTTVSFLLGDSITAYTLTISIFMLAMGVGAILSQQFPDGDELSIFLFVEAALSVVCAGSTLFITYAALLDLAWTATVLIAFLIGLLIGFEIPLLTRFNERRQILLKSNMAMVFGADYLGSFIAGLSYSMLLLPTLGTVLTPVFSGALNLSIAALLAFTFRDEFPPKRIAICGILAAGTLLFLGLQGEKLAFDADQDLFEDPVIFVEQSKHQRIHITHLNGINCLHLNGGTQFCSHDERRYHELLVHPAFCLKPDARRVLILGGGDGLAVREVLKYPNAQAITLVDLDPLVVEISRTHPIIRKLNEEALDDPLVTIHHEDAYVWLKNNSEFWDIILIDLPDPERVELAKLYSLEFYRNLRNHLAPDGAIALQSTSPLHATRAFGIIWATLTRAGLSTVPYRIQVPSFGDWGFNIAVRDDHLSTDQMKARLDAFEERVPLQVLNQAAMQAATRFEKGLLPDNPDSLEISRLLNPTIHLAYREAWEHER